MMMIMEPLFREDKLSPSVTMLSLQSQVPALGSSEDEHLSPLVGMPFPSTRGHMIMRATQVLRELPGVNWVLLLVPRGPP